MMNLSSKPYTQELISRVNSRKTKVVEVKPSTKSELVFKVFRPKVPKSGKSIYDGFYIRKLDGTEFVYHIESELFIARMNGKDGRVWVDENYDEIHKRIQKVLDNE